MKRLKGEGLRARTVISCAPQNLVQNFGEEVFGAF